MLGNAHKSLWLIGELFREIKLKMQFRRVLILLSANVEAEQQTKIGTILNVVDVFLPEVTLLLDKRLHHLNTRAILKDQGKLYGFVLLISNCFINSSAITCLTITPSGWSMMAVSRLKMSMTWSRWTWTPWEAITPSAKEEKLTFSPTTTLSMICIHHHQQWVPFDLIEQSSSSAHDAGRKGWDESKFLPVPTSTSVPSHRDRWSWFYNEFWSWCWRMTCRIRLKKSHNLIATTSACAVGSPFCTRRLWPWKTSKNTLFPTTTTT